MPAQQQHYITTAYLTGATGPIAVGTVLCFTNTATDRFVVATTANLATYGQNPACITLTAGDNTNVAVEVQQVGFVPNSITGLGAGAAGSVCVNSSGNLARGTSPSIVGTCDAEGNAQINFSGVGTSSGGATFGGSNGDVMVRASSTTSTGLSPGVANNIIASNGSAWVVTPGIVVPAGSVDDPVGLDGTGGLKVITISGFTAGNDLSGTSSSQNVLAATGSSSLFTIRSTAPTMQWVTAAVNPTLKQQDDTTNSVTGDTLTVQAQNCTGTTTAGGNLILTSGTGTSSHGLVEIQVGGSPRIQLTGTAFALGDILVGDGTKLIRRAKGSALQVLRVNAGGTDLEFATISTTITGTDTHVLFFDGANNPAGDAGFVYDKTNDRVTVAGEIRIGSTVTNTDGLGLANNTAIYFRNAANSLNITAFQVDSSNVVRIGDSNSANVVISYESTAGFFNGDSGVYDFLLNEDASIQSRLPRLGLNMPYASEGTATIALGSFSAPGNTNITNADQSRQRLNFTGSLSGGSGSYTITFPTPGSADEEHPKIVKNSTDYALDMKTSGGTTVSVAAGAHLHIWVGTAGLTQIN